MVAMGILQKKRKRITMKCKYHGIDVCQKELFYFYTQFGKDKLQRVKTHYINGLEPCVHKNMKCVPKHATPYFAKVHVVKFLQTYTEKNALLLPGKIPGYKRDDIKFLPSSKSKNVTRPAIIGHAGT